MCKSFNIEGCELFIEYNGLYQIYCHCRNHNMWTLTLNSMQSILYKITWLKSDTSILWKLWRGHSEYLYYNVQGVLLWQMETLF